MHRDRVRRQDRTVDNGRRELLKFALGSPLLLTSATVPAIDWIFAEAAQAEGSAPGARELIARSRDGIDVFDYESVAEAYRVSLARRFPLIALRTTQ